MPSTSSLLKIYFPHVVWGKGSTYVKTKITFIKPNIAIAIPVQGSVILKWHAQIYLATSKFFLYHTILLWKL